MRTLFLAATTIALMASAQSVYAQDVEAGEASFRKCAACHAIGPDAKNKVGPELNGIDGRKAGSVEGYNYSNANKNSGITWDETSFKEYVQAPTKKVPGTKMAFAGIKNEKELASLWLYVKQFNATGEKK